MIKALYEAAQAGVTIKLIVRGICCLIPGLSGVSENVKVVSIVGRYLEHSRIFYFYQDGTEAIYLSSADLMERNLNRRVEAMCPVLDEKIKSDLKNILEITLSDTAKMRIMKPDGTYKKARSRGGRTISCQEIFSKENSELF
jgi:polyphosphate kinase